MRQAMLQQYEQAQHEQGNKLAQSKGRDNRKWSRWRQGFVTISQTNSKIVAIRSDNGESSFSCKKHVSVWRGCGTQCSREANEGRPIYPHALTNARCRN